MLSIFEPNRAHSNIIFLGNAPANTKKIEAMRMAERAKNALAILNAKLARKASQQAIADQQQAEFRRQQAAKPVRTAGVTVMSLAFARAKQVIVADKPVAQPAKVDKPAESVYMVEVWPSRAEGGKAGLLRSAARNGYTHYRFDGKVSIIPKQYR